MKERRQMAAQPATVPYLPHELLGACPSCTGVVVADASAVRYEHGWYHLICALEQQSVKS